MIVKELFDKASYEEIWDYLAKNYFADSRYDSKRDSFKENLAKSVEIIRGMTPRMTTNWIVFFETYRDDMDLENETLYLDMYLYEKENIANNFQLDELIENGTDISDWSQEQITAYMGSCCDKRPISYGIEFSPWEEVLGYDVYAPTAEKYGAVACASVILFEMTYFGFTPEEQADEEARIFSRREEECVPAEDCLDELVEAFDDPPIVFDEEEIKEENRRSFVICHENFCRVYQLLKAYKFGNGEG